MKTTNRASRTRRKKQRTDLHPIEIAAQAVGSQVELARLLGMSPQGVTKMKRNGITPERVLDIERVSGVSRHILRPDLHPVEPCPNCGYLIGASKQPRRGGVLRHSRTGQSNGGQEAR